MPNEMTPSLRDSRVGVGERRGNKGKRKGGLGEGEWAELGVSWVVEFGGYGASLGVSWSW